MNCNACAGGQAVGTLVPPRAGGMLFVEFLLAFVEFYKVRFCLPPCLVGVFFVFPSPHLLIVKNFAGVYVLDVGLHLVLVARGDINGFAYFLLSIELAGVGGDIGSEIPFDTEGCKCLFRFEGGNDAPLFAEVFENCFDGFIGVADVIVIQLLNVGWFDDVLHQAVDYDSINGLLFSVLLLHNFVFVVELCLVDEGGAVGEVVSGEWWCVQAVSCVRVVAGDGLKFLVVDDEGKASVAASRLCCFHRGCEFCALLIKTKGMYITKKTYLIFEIKNFILMQF